jgi:hypothetical protein
VAAVKLRPQHIGIMTFFLAFLLAVSAVAKKRVLVYSGKLLDERAGPIGGVFPLTFAFYTKSRGGTPVWQEQHFVGVDNGLYLIELGRKKAIPGSVSLDNLYVGVRITGGPELVRERFVPESSNEEVIHEQGAKPPTTQQQGGTVDYAEKAGFAYSAESAQDAKRLDGLTLDQIKKSIGSEGGGGGGGGGAVTIGTNTFNAPTAGGDGGTPFQQLCPEGYVVTGLRGASGLYLDRIGIICSPLESKKGGKPAQP